jgi:hypothetical protein
MAALNNEDLIVLAHALAGEKVLSIIWPILSKRCSKISPRILAIRSERGAFCCKASPQSGDTFLRPC